MNHTVTDKLVAGELCNLTIKGACYIETSDDGDGRKEHSFDLPGLTETFWLPEHTAIRVERVAPIEWPPRTGDVWEDRNRAKWFGCDRGGDVRLVSAMGDTWSDFGEVLEHVGPMRLLYRDGWTPRIASENVDVPLADEPVDERATFVANLRAFADFMESRADVPVPDSCRAQHSILRTEVPDHADRLAKVRRVAAAIGGDERENATYLYFGGRYAFGNVFYVVHAEAEPDTPEVELSDAQLDTAEAEPDAAPAGCECDDCLDERQGAPLPHRAPDRMTLPEALADAEALGLLSEVTA